MKPYLTLCMSLALHAVLNTAAPAQTLDMASFGTRPDGGDSTPGVLAALKKAREEGTRILRFEPGRYDFWPDHAAERYLFVSNNDEGLKRIAFPLTDMAGLEIDGGGATFVFHGSMVPFLLQGAKNVTLRNFSIDFKRPFHSEGRVMAITPENVDLEFSDEYPHEVRNGVLVFTDGGKRSGPRTTVKSSEEIYPYGSLLAFDPDRRETAYMATDYYEVGEGITAKDLGSGRIRLLLPKVSAKTGNILVFSPKWRANPGVVIDGSSQVRLSGVTLHHTGGMGVIAQFSEDLFLDKVRVTPPPGGKRIVSLTADATHFVNCKGKIEMTDCLFEQQKDDATNVHGLYAKITRLIAPNRIEVRMIHPQQAGVNFVKPGTRLELTDGPSLQPLGYVTARSVERINKHVSIIETETSLPDSITLGDAIADADANTAEVLIRNCVIRGNRARGILLGSRGKMVIDGNSFHTPGAAILFEGDASHWFEQAGVRDVSIRGNIFDNCNYGVWGTACIQVGSGITGPFRKSSRYNRNITINDNLFRVFSPMPLLSIYSVDGLTFVDNRLEPSTEYSTTPATTRRNFDVIDCDNVKVEEPLVTHSSTGSR